MLLKYAFGNKVFKFTQESDRVPGQNVFTILVGKNGSGKSRLLSGIVSETLGMKSGVRTFDPGTLQAFPRTMNERLDYATPPEKVIAASTSPFDKFPLPKRNTKVNHYSYLGLRDLQSHNFGLAYLSKIMFELISSVVWDHEQMAEISNVLGYLGYTDRILLKLELKINRLFSGRILTVEDIETEFQISLRNNSFQLVGLNKRFFMDEEGEMIDGKIQHLTDILRRNDFDHRRRHSVLTLSNNGIVMDESFPGHIEDLLFLFEAGLISLRGVELEERFNGDVFSISEASSGEQCVVIGILGLASQICDNALICIDEPEICLHPEWQERYIRILISTFRNYKNCHFIIATHSPQIISNLESENCFILSMESRKTINASTVNHNSIDFQLANVFHAPGFKNEYLSRIALNTFAKVSKYKSFDAQDRENFKLLYSVSEFIEEDDPLAALVFSLTKLKELYA